MKHHARVLRVFPVVESDGRRYLDVVTDLVQEPPSPNSALVAEIKQWATSFRDQRYPGHEIRYDWETNA